jgi:hypothetical protein
LAAELQQRGAQPQFTAKHAGQCQLRAGQRQCSGYQVDAMVGM